jgi:putative endonuclease
MTRGEHLPPIKKVAAQRERHKAFQLGLSAESRAALYLIVKGFRILARRWKNPAGELDLVVRRRKLLLFVEVKARTSFDEAAESVTPRQQQRIVAAARAWLAIHPDPLITEIRFDVILITPGKWPRHIQAAFEARS